MTPAVPHEPTSSPPISPPPRGETREILDVELVRRIARGRNEALSELCRRYSPQLQGLAVRMLRNTHDAEDVLQEVYLYVWRNACRYDAMRASVTSWLVLITRSRCLDRLRKLRRIDGLQEELHYESPAPRAAAEGFAEVLSRERAARVRQVLAGLPVPQRLALELAFFRGWTQKEVAERMGVPLGTVKTRTFLAMKKLRRKLTGELPQLM